MLAPNALKVLDALELYERVKVKGYSFELLEFKDAKGALLETYGSAANKDTDTKVSGYTGMFSSTKSSRCLS